MTIRLDRDSGTIKIGGLPLRFLRHCKELLGLDQRYGYFWVRWLFLRLLGLIFILTFTDCLRDGQGLFGPLGIIPVKETLDVLAQGAPLLKFLLHPTLFWINASGPMVTLVSSVGLLAATFLFFNILPRGALLACWFCFLAFTPLTKHLLQFQVDALLLESAFLGIFLAPGGFRPGLGRNKPPAVLTIFLLRWLIFRLMYESAISKYTYGEPTWWNFSAMKYVYETSPFPTELAFRAFHLPQWCHVIEILAMLLAEIGAPLLAIASRRLRWTALIIWSVFQVAITLTGNYGYLNYLSIGLGLFLLDDQLLSRLIPASKTTKAANYGFIRRGWRRWIFYAPLAANFLLSFILFTKYIGLPLIEIAPFRAIIEYSRGFQSANEFYLYSVVAKERMQLRIEGSNDGGKTWRPYEYRFALTGANQISPLVSPYFPRFDASMQLLLAHPTKRWSVSLLGQNLLKERSETLALFKRNPFPDKPPDRIAFPIYKMQFVELEKNRSSGHYWTISYSKDYLPVLVYDRKSGQFRDER